MCDASRTRYMLYFRMCGSSSDILAGKMLKDENVNPDPFEWLSGNNAGSMTLVSGGGTVKVTWIPTFKNLFHSISFQQLGTQSLNCMETFVTVST